MGGFWFLLVSWSRHWLTEGLFLFNFPCHMCFCPFSNPGSLHCDAHLPVLDFPCQLRRSVSSIQLLHVWSTNLPDGQLLGRKLIVMFCILNVPKTFMLKAWFPIHGTTERWWKVGPGSLGAWLWRRYWDLGPFLLLFSASQPPWGGQASCHTLLPWCSTSPQAQSNRAKWSQNETYDCDPK
jgi:hypothetical protein